MHFLRGILNLWKIRGKCDSPDHKPGRWEEEVFIKLTRTVRKAGLASDTGCCEERMPCCLGQSDVRRNICDQLEAGTLRNATALSQAKPTDSASFITGPRRWGQFRHDIYITDHLYSHFQIHSPDQRRDLMGQEEVRPPAKHAIDHFKELHRQGAKKRNKNQALAKCRFTFLWCVNLLTRHQSKSFYDN